VFALACWMRFLRGEDHEGAPTDPRRLLSEHDVFGCLSNDVRLARALEHALQLLERGPRHAATAITRGAVAASQTDEEDTRVA
jgi:hypothetical protein